MRKIYGLFFLMSFAVCAFAQPSNSVTPAIMLKVADQKLAENDYYNALDWYERYYKEERDLDIAYKIASMHGSLRDYNKAEKWFKRIVERKSKKANPYMPDARFDYARYMKMNGNYEGSIEQFDTFLNEAENPDLIVKAKIEKEGAIMAQSMEEAEGMVVENAGNNVNTKYSEYSPVLLESGDMYFTAIQGDDVLVVDGKNEVFSKAYMARSQGDGYTEAVALGAEINREGFHTGNLTVSGDGSRMYFTRAKLEGNILGSSEIFYSEKTSDGWGAASALEGINGDHISKQPSIGELFGNEVLYFVSNMEGGYGGYDIYYATHKGDGIYGDPVNLGNTINTAGNEETPFYKDGTLYFSTEGLPGMGGFDIFSSIWNGSSWSDPANMGKGYNTSVDDLYFTLDPRGYKGFLVSNREGTRSVKSKTCCNDIYSVAIEEMVLDLNTLTFAKGENLNGVSIELVEVATGEIQRGTASNTASFILKPETAYRVVGTKEGYKPASAEFNTVGVEKSKTFTENLDLAFIPPPPPPPPPPPEDEYIVYEENQPIRLNNIYYDYNDAKILTDAESDLSLILELMNQYSDMVIELGSHTDSRGSDPYNEKLSGRRAASAKSWLVGRGIVESRIKAVGYGESTILNTCTNGVTCSDEEHRFNRRTEFKIISGPTSIKIKKTRLKKK